jgi:dTDP-4-amino-4,6-dideoxygalactose transaminase
MLYGRHGAGPDLDVFAEIRLDTPNMSGRMDNLRAAILRPQIAGLDGNIRRWNERYRAVEDEFRRAAPPLRVIPRPAAEGFVGSSIQFLLPGIAPAQAEGFIAALLADGIEVKWFGAAEPVAFTSNHKSWRYFAAQTLPRTDRILSGLFDMRLPLTFSLQDCAEIGRGIADTARRLALQNAA